MKSADPVSGLFDFILRGKTSRQKSLNICPDILPAILKIPKYFTHAVERFIFHWFLRQAFEQIIFLQYHKPFDTAMPEFGRQPVNNIFPASSCSA